MLSRRLVRSVLVTYPDACRYEVDIVDESCTCPG